MVACSANGNFSKHLSLRKLFRREERNYSAGDNAPDKSHTAQFHLFKPSKSDSSAVANSDHSESNMFKSLENTVSKDDDDIDDDYNHYYHHT